MRKADKRKEKTSKENRTEKKMTTPVNKKFPNKLKEKVDERGVGKIDQRIGDEEPENPTDR